MSRPTKTSQLSYEDKLKKLTPEEREFLSDVVKGKKDPVYFANKLLGLEVHDGQKLWLWMTTKTETARAFLLGLEMGKWKSQAEFEELLKRNPDFLRNILVPSNRWGKTLVTTIKHLWYNYYKIGVRGQHREIKDARCGTLNLSPHSNQCEAGYQYILDILQSKLVWVLDGKSFKNDCKIPEFYESQSTQKRRVLFSNGTSYRAVPTGEDQASSLAGTPYLYISYDECAQSLHLKDELPAKIMSRLIDYGGPMDLVSTPEVDKPSHQYFFHIAKLGMKGEDGWWTLVGKITDNFFLGKREVEQTAASIKSTDPVKYRQVMYGEFVTTGAKMFDTLIIERLWDRQEPETPLHEHKYLVIGDWGFSDTGDPSVFYVIDYTELLNEKIPVHLRKVRIVFTESISGGSPIAVLTRAKILQREWNGAKFIHDASALGGVMIKKMLKEMDMHDVVDFNASGGVKMDMLFSLLVWLTANRKTELGPENEVIELNPDFGRIRSYHIPALEEQAGNYQYNPDKGITDKKLEQDHIMALGMGIWWLDRKFNKDRVKQINFNPFAAEAKNIFPGDEKEVAEMKIKHITIPEKHIS